MDTIRVEFVRLYFECKNAIERYVYYKISECGGCVAGNFNGCFYNIIMEHF
jgi:predicted house-cleaning NTP pyrophosphatase (Maf/HAM1 superfamily)